MACIAALLLAAGESSRMGELKALLPWQGKTLLERQVAALESAGVSRTIVVLGHQSEKLEPPLSNRAGVLCVYNPDYRQGKTTSIKAGLRGLRQSQDCSTGAFQEDAILVLNVDQPRSSDIIRRIMELHLQTGTSGRTCLITIPTYRGKGGHPMVLSTSLIDELLNISEDTLGIKAIVRRHEEETQRVEMDSPELLLDLNTPQDYQKALEMFVSG